MSLDTGRRRELEALCLKFRRDVLTAIHGIQSGHPGGSLSVCEILTVIYFEKGRFSPEIQNDPSRDRLVLTKGHAAPMLYRILAEKGFFPVGELSTLRRIDSRLQGHPSKHTAGIDIPTGPLGIGLAAAQGMALAQKLDGYDNARTYAVLGDGELNEGTVWETAMSAVKFKLDNLIGVVDRNHVQLDGTSDEIMPMGDVGEKFRSFGWNVLECNGHDMGALCDAIDAAKARTGAPTVIIADTVKGKGVSFMEGQAGWHGKAIDRDSFDRAMAELGGAV